MDIVTPHVPIEGIALQNEDVEAQESCHIAIFWGRTTRRSDGATQVMVQHKAGVMRGWLRLSRLTLLFHISQEWDSYCKMKSLKLKNRATLQFLRQNNNEKSRFHWENDDRKIVGFLLQNDEAEAQESHNIAISEAKQQREESIPRENDDRKIVGFLLQTEWWGWRSRIEQHCNFGKSVGFLLQNEEVEAQESRNIAFPEAQQWGEESSPIENDDRKESEEDFNDTTQDGESASTVMTSNTCTHTTRAQARRTNMTNCPVLFYVFKYFCSQGLHHPWLRKLRQAPSRLITVWKSMYVNI